MPSAISMPRNLQYVQDQGTLYTAMVSLYAALGGWVNQAEQMTARSRLPSRKADRRASFTPTRWRGIGGEGEIFHVEYDGE